MKKELYISNLDSADLKMYYCGYESCKPGHSYGPAMKDHYLFVYIKHGRGIYRVNGITYQLQAKDSFFQYPHEPSFYQADFEDPWEYMWIGFYGNIAANYLEYAGISPTSPIHHHQNPEPLEQLFTNIIQYPNHKSIDTEIRCIGLLYLLFSEIIKESLLNENEFIIKERSLKDNYIEKAINFIHLNYTRDITAASIAEHVGLERSYFSRIFKSNLGRGPYEFLLKYRIEKALRLLTHTTLQIEQIAYSVGFNNPLYFSKVFKKHMGISPSSFRKKNQELHHKTPSV